MRAPAACPGVACPGTGIRRERGASGIDGDQRCWFRAGDGMAAGRGILTLEYRFDRMCLWGSNAVIYECCKEEV